MHLPRSPRHAVALKRHRALLMLLGSLLLAGHAGLAHAAQVDLSIKTPSLSLAAGGAGTRVLTVSNEGQSTTAPVEVTYVTPPLVNVNLAIGLPAGCTFIYQNADPLVPSVVRCVIAGGIPSGQSVAVTIPVVAAASASPGHRFSRTIALPTGADVEVAINNNISGAAVSIESTGGFSYSGNTNLYVGADSPALSTGAAANPVKVVVGNNGPGTTTGQARMTAATTFFENFVPTSLPAGCTYLLQNADPSVPEIVQCLVPAGLAPGASQRFDFELNLAPGGPTGTAGGFFTGVETTVPGDVDPDTSDNAFNATNVVFAPATAELALPTTTLPPGTVMAGPPFLPPATTGPGAAVDLFISATALAVLPQQSVPITFTVGNSGQSATGQVRLIFQTPFFVNVDATQLPANCAFLYQNTDFTVPSIVQCLLNGPASGQSVSQTLQVITAPNIPKQRVWGIAVAMPAYGSADVEQYLADNELTVVTSVLQSGVPPGAQNLVGITVGQGVIPDLTTDREGVSTLLVSNHGAMATQGNTLLTYLTPVFVNVGASAPLPAGCAFLYQNADPAVPSIVQCVISASIPVGGQVAVPIPVAMPPATYFGFAYQYAIAVPQNLGLDIQPDLSTTYMPHTTTLSQLPPHSLNFYLHTTDIPGTAGGFTMNQSPPAAPAAAVALAAGASQSWFSDPMLVGTFMPGASFIFQMPCTLGVSVAGTFTLASTALDGSNTRTLGTTTQPLSVCLLGARTVNIPLLTPQSLDQRRLKLTITNSLGLTLSLQPNAGIFLGTTLYEGTP